MKKKFKLSGLRGEVFNNNGKVAGAIPPLNRADGIPFCIGTVWPATDKFPAWADMVVRNRIRVRINPEICKPPFFRLFDLVALIGQQEQMLFEIADGSDDKFLAEFQRQVFYIWPASIGEHRVLMVDTNERVWSWHPPADWP